MVEVPPETVERAFVVVDDVAAASREAGDLIPAGREPDATLGDLLAERIRPTHTDATLFKSVGIASQDASAAAAALARADEHGIGVDIDH
jgi:ornithine cyclodeaminase